MKTKRSKRYTSLLKNSKKDKPGDIEEIITKVKSNCNAKFDESIDLSIFLNLKQKKEEASLRTLANLPYGNGKKIKVAVLCEESKIKEAKDAGADLFDFEEGQEFGWKNNESYDIHPITDVFPFFEALGKFLPDFEWCF